MKLSKEVMTVSKKVNGTTAVTTGAPHRATPTMRSRHRRAGVVTRPVVETGAMGIDRSLIAELRDWTVLAAVSAAAWASAAIAFGAVTPASVREASGRRRLAL